MIGVSCLVSLCSYGWKFSKRLERNEGASLAQLGRRRQTKDTKASSPPSHYLQSLAHTCSCSPCWLESNGWRQAAKKPKLLDHLPAPPVFLLDSNDCCSCHIWYLIPHQMKDIDMKRNMLKPFSRFCGKSCFTGIFHISRGRYKRSKVLLSRNSSSTKIKALKVSKIY